MGSPCSTLPPLKEKFKRKMLMGKMESVGVVSAEKTMRAKKTASQLGVG
jgi:hypothetical protein